MGTWGAGSFENDAALDWVAECSSIDHIKQKFADLEALDEDDNLDTTPQIDADTASEVIAAAEIVAAMMGRVAPDVPQDVLERLGDAGKPDAKLIDRAKHSVSWILAGSELLELWSEDGDDPNEWNIAMTGLIDRLNADVACNPPSKKEIEKTQGYLTTCSFCDKGIADDQIFQLEFRDLSTEDGLYVSRGLYCHLACLNGKLHSKHMIQNWRFNIDDAEVDRLLGKEPD